MPSFGRIGKHSNRSQNALASAQEPSTPSSAGAAAVAGQAQAQLQGQGQGQVQGQVQGQGQGQVQASPSTATQTTSPQALTSSQGATATNKNPTAAALSGAPPKNKNKNLITKPNLSTQGIPQEPLSASPSTAFDAGDSFDNGNQQQEQQRHQLLHHGHAAQDSLSRPPPHDYDPSSLALHTNNSSQAPFDHRQRPQQHDFVDSVSRSQSQRYSVATPYSIHPPHYGPASSSVDDLQNTNYHHQGPGQPLPPAAQQPEPKSRSARRLIRNIFSGKDTQQQHQQQQQQQQQQHPHHLHQHSQSQQLDQTGSLGRRPSKRVRNPPNFPTGVSQVSQLSLDEPSDWTPRTADTQPSPLQAFGDHDDQYFARRSDSNRDILVQDSQHEANRNSIRYVQSDLDNSPYEDLNFQQHQQSHPLLQQASPDQQVQYGQAIFDPNPRQQQQQQQPPPQHQYQRSEQLRGQSHFPGGPPPIVTTTATGHLLATQQPQQNPETISQLSHESPATDSDARSGYQQLSTQGSPAGNYAGQIQDNPSPVPPASAGPSPQHQQAIPPQQRNMAPGAPSSDRRAQGSEKTLRGSSDLPSGAPASYRHSQSSGGPAAGQSNTLRAGTGQERPPQFDNSGADQGRNSPQPSNPDRDATDPDKIKELLTKYKNVKRLFFDGKAQIEQLNSQVEQLQNAVANQRITQSRTALDDGEYLNRFKRLNGAIDNLSFNIRKDWKTVPQWLSRYISVDALKTGKQEMMVVGRAVITRWLVEEIFNKCFHPGLDFELSRQLKDIERNIRLSSYTINAQEEYEAHTNKIVQWRMATLDGLQPVLNSQQSVDFRQDFTRMCTTNLTAALFQHLTDPPPPGVDGSATTIVELAVGIAANLPVESRDVAITYPLPGEPVNINIMDIEKTTLPQLEMTKEAELVEDDEGDMSEKTGGKGGQKPRGGKDTPRVRLAAFLAVEVRNRQVLLKAPVFTLG